MKVDPKWVTLNQRVQGSSPCAPTIESERFSEFNLTGANFRAPLWARSPTSLPPMERLVQDEALTRPPRSSFDKLGMRDLGYGIAPPGNLPLLKIYVGVASQKSGLGNAREATRHAARFPRSLWARSNGKATFRDLPPPHGAGEWRLLPKCLPACSPIGRARACGAVGSVSLTSGPRAGDRRRQRAKNSLASNDGGTGTNARGVGALWAYAKSLRKLRIVHNNISLDYQMSICFAASITALVA